MDSAQLHVFATRYTTAWCSQDAPRVASFFSETGSLQINGGPPSVGRPAITAAAHGFMTAFPDMVVTMDGIERQAELCRAHPTRSKWVFVPSHAVGRTIGERLALGGTNWLNLRFVTPLDIALRMGAPFLVERGVEPSEEGLGPALAMRLMLELRETDERTSTSLGEVADERGSCRRTAPPVLGAKGTRHGSGACAAGGAAPSGATRFGAPTHVTSAASDGYFRPLADQPTMAQALWATLRELRMCGIRGAGLQAGRDPLIFENPLKQQELAALLASYERHLAENQRADMADVYVEALEHADWCPIQPADCWTELPDVVWTPLQLRLIDRMPGEHAHPPGARDRQPDAVRGDDDDAHPARPRAARQWHRADAAGRRHGPHPLPRTRAGVQRGRDRAPPAARRSSDETRSSGTSARLPGQRTSRTSTRFESQANERARRGAQREWRRGDATLRQRTLT